MNEVQMGLAIYGLLITVLTFVGVTSSALLWGTLGFMSFGYLAGLLVQAARGVPRLVFLREGGVGGAGYIESFRSVERCLFLMHVDDDPPSDDLQALYRTLLGRGVQIRRTVFLRPDAAPSAYDWIVRFGNHPNLHHRVVLPEQASIMRMSFVVVDERVVLLSVPGHEAIDGQAYTDRLVLKHLLRIDDRQVATAFQRIHEGIWQHAKPIADVKDLLSAKRLMGDSLAESA